ncbi:MFS transporter [Streptomyces niveiscabiei]|uniref:MFS transporter n=1 Tax=Streptomyces niveiscabiei TaxID=164115 RepID=UPI0029BD4C12|nr:MFS transporter [Streptomyces niveiscabiei]MDX3384119.1 MFS transporter [Streptomyces niveiscabiei]
MGRDFRWLWGAYAVSVFGTWLAFDAFPMIAVLALDASPAAVSALAAVGPAVGALAAVPLGPWVEYRRKRPVMVAMDVVRCVALLSVPLAYALGVLGLAQLLLVSVVVAAADITFTSASGAFVKWLVPKDQLLAANGRFESTMWTATMVGPPLGGAAIGAVGPVVTVIANAVSFLLSALGLARVRGREPEPVKAPALDWRELLEGWRYILADSVLRPLLLNAMVVNGLVMAGMPLLAVLLLGELGLPPWQYALAFAVPCVGGLIGSRLARHLVPRRGRRRMLLWFGTLRACWPVGLAFVGPGVAGLALIMLVEFGLIICSAAYNTVLSTFRLESTPADRVTRVLSAWSVSTKAGIASLTALWGVVAGMTGTRTALGLAGVVLLATPLMLLGVRKAAAPAEKVAG